MSRSLRSSLEVELGLEVFSFFGTTETGSFGAECNAHCGTHIYNDAVIPTLISPIETPDAIEGEVAWTTLHFFGQPLIKYVTGDYIRISKNRCPCGLSFPLMTAIRRTEDQFILFGQKYRYDAFHETLAEELGNVPWLEIELNSNSTYDVVTFALPIEFAASDPAVRRAILRTDDLHEFVTTQHLSLRTVYRNRPSSTRKVRRVRDLRQSASGVGCGDWSSS